MELTKEQMSELSDEVLCVNACAGDRASEEALVMRYQQLTRACARPYFLAGGDSEDLIQEAMFGLLKAIREFDPGRNASFHTFAEVCVRNRIRSAVAAAARGKHTPLNHSVPFERSMLGNDSNPEELVITREEGEERLNFINRQLSPLEQRILALYLQGLSYRDIAYQVGRPEKAVDNAVQRIRRKVAKVYGVFSES